MASEPVRIERYLHAADTDSTLAAVAALGALVEVNDGQVRVRGTGLREARDGGGVIDVGNAGTLLRLLPGWLASQEGRSFTLDGDESIRRRPVQRIVTPLRQMGAELHAREDRYTPLRVDGAHLHGIDYELDVASAQVKSCILLAAIDHRAGPQPRSHGADAAACRGFYKPPGQDAHGREHRRDSARADHCAGRPQLGCVPDRGGGARAGLAAVDLRRRRQLDTDGLPSDPAPDARHRPRRSRAAKRGDLGR
jgi:hypothetical protein